MDFCGWYVVRDTDYFSTLKIRNFVKYHLTFCVLTHPIVYTFVFKVIITL